MSSGILFEIIVSRQCNKRCSYCNLEFNNNKQTEETLAPIIEFIHKQKSSHQIFHLNYFGWEPLLEFDLIRYCINQFKDYPYITYSIGTNGLLMTEDMLAFFYENKVQVCISIDGESYMKLFENKKFLFAYPYLQTNFILSPENIDSALRLLLKTQKLWVKKLNFIPVYFTQKWNERTLRSLYRFRKSLNLLNIEFWFFSYYQKPTSDIEFIYETDGSIYRDLHSHLWFLYQYSQVPIHLKNDIREFSLLGTLEEKTLSFLFEKHCTQDIFEYSIHLAKALWFEKDFAYIDAIVWNNSNIEYDWKNIL